MSYMKRFAEDLCATVSDAIYEECFDMADYADSTRSDVEESVIEQIFSGQYRTVLDYLRDRFTTEADMPMTAEAIADLQKLDEMENRRTAQ